MKKKKTVHKNVGAPLIGLERGEDCFHLNMDAHAWRGVGRIGQLGVLSDWISLLQNSTFPEKKVEEGE